MRQETPLKTPQLRSLVASHIELIVRRALEEREQRRKQSRTTRERLKALEVELYEQAREKYNVTAKEPSAEDFDALWSDGLRDEVIREHLALEQLKTNLRKRRSNS